jgi:hypothetical protein
MQAGNLVRRRRGGQRLRYTCSLFEWQRTLERIPDVGVWCCNASCIYAHSLCCDLDTPTLTTSNTPLVAVWESGALPLHTPFLRL